MSGDANGKLLIVDADAHVVECDRTWDYLEPSEQQFRPVPLAAPEDGGVTLQFWLVDGKVRGNRFPAFSEEELRRRQEQVGRKFAEAREARELGNVGLRLEHMDDIGVDVQVLHNTMFIEEVTERAPVEVALCGSWNRWLADIWSQSDGRLRWSCLAPTLSMSDALDQIRFSREHGACAVLMRPVEGNRLLVDPYFYPIYEEASRLDMAIAVHIANAAPGSTTSTAIRSGWEPFSTASASPPWAASPTCFSARSRSCSRICAGDSSRPAPNGCRGSFTRPGTGSGPGAGNGRTIPWKRSGCS